MTGVEADEQELTDYPPRTIRERCRLREAMRLYHGHDPRGPRLAHPLVRLTVHQHPHG